MRTIASIESAHKAKHARRRKRYRSIQAETARRAAATARAGCRLSSDARHRPLYGGVRGGIGDGPAFPPFGDFVSGAMRLGEVTHAKLDALGDMYGIGREPHQGGGIVHDLGGDDAEERIITAAGLDSEVQS